MRPSTSRIFQTPFAVDPNDFIITHEQFTWSNTWSGTSTHYYQDFVLSSQFDLTTTLIEPQFIGAMDNATDRYDWEIIDDAGGTIVRVWARYNSKVEPDDLIVEITQGLSYVDYVEITPTLSNATTTACTETVSTVPDWNDGAVHITVLAAGQGSYLGKTGSTQAVNALWQARLTSATVLAFKAQGVNGHIGDAIWQVAIWRY